MYVTSNEPVGLSGRRIKAWKSIYCWICLYTNNPYWVSMTFLLFSSGVGKRLKNSETKITTMGLLTDFLISVYVSVPGCQKEKNCLLEAC